MSISTIQQASTADPSLFSDIPQHLLTDEILSRLPPEEYKTAERVCKAFQNSCHEIHQKLECRKQVFRKCEPLEEQLQLFGISSRRSTEKAYKKFLIHGHRILFQTRPDRTIKYFSDLKKRIEEVNTKLPLELKTECTTEYTADGLALSLPPSELENFFRQATQYAFEDLSKKPLDQLGMISDEETEQIATKALVNRKRKKFNMKALKDVDWEFIGKMQDLPHVKLSVLQKSRITDASKPPLSKPHFKAAKKIVQKTFPPKGTRRLGNMLAHKFFGFLENECK